MAEDDWGISAAADKCPFTMDSRESVRKNSI